MFRAVHFISVKRRSVLARENELRAARRAARSTCTAVVHVEDEGRWLRVSERHTYDRMRSLSHFAMMFDDGYDTAAREAKKLNAWLPSDRRSAAPYAHVRDFLLNFTDDEILAARVALDFCGPALSYGDTQ